MRTRPRAAGFALVFSLLIVLSAAGVGAYTGSQLVVGSIHTTDTDFQSGSLFGMDTTGNDAISVKNESVEYNPVIDEGDGVDNSDNFVGDTFDDNTIHSEVKINPDQDGVITALTPDIDSVGGTDYGFTVDIYIVKENPDTNYGEGTLVKSGWDPAFSTGEQTIDINNYQVTSGTNYTIEFVTSGTNSDGDYDVLLINQDDSATNTWFTNSQGRATDRYIDLTSNISYAPTRPYYISDNHTVENTESAFVNVTNATNVSYTVTWKTGAGAQLAQNTYTTTGNKTLTWSTSSATDIWTNVSIQKTGSSPQFTLVDEGVEFTNEAPKLDNSSATPTGDLAQATNSFEIDVNDSTFGLAQGDSVTGWLYVDGSNTSKSDTITSNGTLSVTHTVSAGGSHTWHYEIEDDYGGTNTSDTFSISTPSEVVIREEELPHDKITTTTGVEITITGSNETVALRNVTDGTIDLTGLPTDETYVFTLDNDNYYVREAYIESVYNQTTIFLLNDSNPAVLNTVTVADRTGDFDTNPTIEVQKVINTSEYPEEPNTSEEWVTISGDRTGASQELDVYLWQDDRYRFVVRSEDGSNERVLGEYTAKTNGTVPLEIGSVQYQYGDADAGYEWGASIENESTGGSVTFSYNDYENLTGNVSLTIKYRNNSSVLVDQDFTTGPYGEIVYTEPISQDEYENESFIVEWSAGRDGEVISGSRAVGAQQPLDLPLDTIWMQVLYAAIALMLAFFVGAVNPALGAVTVSLWSGLAWYMGIVPVELGAGAIVLAIALSVWMMVNQSRTGVGV